MNGHFARMAHIHQQRNEVENAGDSARTLNGAISNDRPYENTAFEPKSPVQRLDGDCSMNGDYENHVVQRTYQSTNESQQSSADATLKLPARHIRRSLKQTYIPHSLAVDSSSPPPPYPHPRPHNRASLPGNACRSSRVLLSPASDAHQSAFKRALSLQHSIDSSRRTPTPATTHSTVNGTGIEESHELARVEVEGRRASSRRVNHVPLHGSPEKAQVGASPLRAHFREYISHDMLYESLNNSRCSTVCIVYLTVLQVTLAGGCMPGTSRT